MRLPLNNLDNLKQTIRFFIQKKEATLKAVQSLIGLRNFACKTVAACRELFAGDFATILENF